MALSPLGIFSAAGAGGGVAFSSDYELISTTILGAPQAAVSFDVSTFGSTYKHFQVRAVTTDTFTLANSSSIAVRLNADTGSNYAWHGLNGNGSTVTSLASTSQTRIFLEQGANGFFSAQIIDILDAYATKNKTLRTLTGRVATSANLVRLSSGLWMNTTGLTSISLTTEGLNFAIGSRFSIYGLKG
jgi:hypothetical protein